MGDPHKGLIVFGMKHQGRRGLGVDGKILGDFSRDLGEVGGNKQEGKVRPECRVIDLIQRKRLAGLSITHNCSSGFESECDVSESGSPAPQNYIAWRLIARPSKVAAKSGDFYYIVG